MVFLGVGAFSYERRIQPSIAVRVCIGASDASDPLECLGFKRETCDPMAAESKIEQMGGVPREQEMLKGHLPRVKYHRVYEYTQQ